MGIILKLQPPPTHTHTRQIYEQKYGRKTGGRAGLVALGASVWEQRGQGVGGVVGDYQHDLDNKSAENNSLDYITTRIPAP